MMSFQRILWWSRKEQNTTAHN